MDGVLQAAECIPGRIRGCKYFTGESAQLKRLDQHLRDVITREPTTPVWKQNFHCRKIKLNSMKTRDRPAGKLRSYFTDHLFLYQ